MPHQINLPAFKKQIKGWQAGLLTRSEFIALFVERLEREDYDTYISTLPDDALRELSSVVNAWESEPWYSLGTHEYGGLSEAESTDLHNRKEEHWGTAITCLRSYLQGRSMTEQGEDTNPPPLRS